MLSTKSLFDNNCAAVVPTIVELESGNANVRVVAVVIPLTSKITFFVLSELLMRLVVVSTSDLLDNVWVVVVPTIVKSASGKVTTRVVSVVRPFN